MSSVSLLIFCLDVLSLIQGEASILISDDKHCEFYMWSSGLCSIPLYSFGLCCGAQLNYLDHLESSEDFPIPYVLQGLYKLDSGNTNYSQPHVSSRNSFLTALQQFFSWLWLGPVMNLQIRTEPKTQEEPSAALYNAYMLAAASLQPCLTLCDPTDGSPPGPPRPWDSPGKNTGVGCHFLLQCARWKVKVDSLSWVHGLQPWVHS